MANVGIIGWGYVGCATGKGFSTNKSNKIFWYDKYKKSPNTLSDIVEKSVELVSKNGFREFFNPFSGEGYGAHNFSWSTLVVDMILS